MPPKKEKATKSKAKQPAVDVDTNGTTEASPPEVNEKDTKDESRAEDVPAHDKAPESQSEQQTDAQTEAHVEAETETESGEKDANPNKRKAAEAAYEEAKSDDAVGAQPEIEPTKDLVSKDDDSAEKPEEETVSRPSKKRKAEAPRKEAREGTRKSGRGAEKSQPSQEQLLNFLLSDAAADLCRPEDETNAIKEQGPDFKTYSSSTLSPFEELLGAVVLSRPINHRLGLRTMRTILNAPYNFNHPKSIIDAGKEKRQQALEDARTQHRGKTSEELGLAAEVIASKFTKDNDTTDASLERLREQGHHDWDNERDLLQHNIKGLGKTGLDILCRRLQGHQFTELYPFTDERSSRGLVKLGLPKDADKLLKLLEQHWSKLDTKSLVGNDEDSKKRKAFTLILERVLGAELESTLDQVMLAAST